MPYNEQQLKEGVEFMTRKIFGICGYESSGKDTVGDYLIRHYDFKKDSFAKPLKDTVAAIFGWSREMMEGQHSESRKWREEPDEFWSGILGKTVTPRWAMQNLGTDILRNHLHTDIWVHSLKRRIELDTNDVVLTDARFPNEIQAIRDLGGKIIRVMRGAEPPWAVDATMANKNIEHYKDKMNNHWKIHSSEWAWLNEKFDFIIDNNKTLGDLYEQVDAILK